MNTESNSTWAKLGFFDGLCAGILLMMLIVAVVGASTGADDRHAAQTVQLLKQQNYELKRIADALEVIAGKRH